MGKGDTPRPMNLEKWINAPFWNRGRQEACQEVKESDGQDAGSIPASSTNFKHKPTEDCVGSDHEIDWDND